MERNDELIRRFKFAYTAYEKACVISECIAEDMYDLADTLSMELNKITQRV